MERPSSSGSRLHDENNRRWREDETEPRTLSFAALPDRPANPTRQQRQAAAGTRPTFRFLKDSPRC
ncbi:hypothetical protein IscW_ISCW009926 [Ixodes scapularis]|uniref:Uncharacterized protein n=1 Tax=Ixodes scapularis TaxID=6945 RepID=B7PYW9_IXOSC|nr:hypothetical protein IscW_ISCW009926 [Ixodes scapularis]|eukprot:XP_002404128.1 hypothetical protein IscW_ISCW009926 [Ixodes scapularis]